jgi:glutamate dehydrogenase
MDTPHHLPLSSEELTQAIAQESKEFELIYRWLEQHMPSSFLDEVDLQARIIIARNLLSFSLQDNYSHIRLKQMAIVICLDGPDADLNILKHYTKNAIRYYRAFVSNEPLPKQKKKNIRIALIYFREPNGEEKLSSEKKEHLLTLVKEIHPELTRQEFDVLLHGLTPRFLRSITEERLKVILSLFFRAKEQDQCQMELRRNEQWQKNEGPSLQLIMAWRNVPKAGFLYRLAKIIYSHGLAVQKMVATYVDPYSTDNIVVLSFGLHGLKGKAGWEEADLQDFLREIALSKFFEIDDPVGTTFVQPRLLTGNEGHLVRNFISFAHQVLVYADPNLYSLAHIIDGFCRHPELTLRLCQAFAMKFDPHKYDLAHYERIKKEFHERIEELDTGQAVNDLRRKNILKQGMNFIHYTLKTNFYQPNKSSFSFRLNPTYLNDVPYDRKEKFPEIPYGIFFIRGMNFISFNIRFKDLARGGLRTVIPEKREAFGNERINLFSEGYNLAYTQQKKNKDIPEGGAKTVILLKPYDMFAIEEEIYRQEMEEDGTAPAIIEEKLNIYRRDQKEAYRNSSQRCFIDSLMTLINCDSQGMLLAESVIDYWKKPEYIYLGPDENISNEMILWIANYATQCNYKPGRSFISSKPGGGINHKEFGVTSYGLNVYLHETLAYLGINPERDVFTLKISGGPDGDVAGNEILNLQRFYPKTAKVLALTDVSGTIYDPKGLDLTELSQLFRQMLPIRHYPPEKLSKEGFLLDLKTKREESAYAQQTLLWKKTEEGLMKEWLSGNEMNHLYRSNVHQTKTDVFITGGGRPRTLNETNYQSFLDEHGKPTAKAIVEGANLYLTPGARKLLEKEGTLILKDSSCNKGGVICSSFEVLASLCMTEQEFLQEKKEYIQQVLEIIRQAALHEAHLLFNTHKTTGMFLSDVSERISEQINLYKYQLLDHFETFDLSKDPKDPLIECLTLYCPPLIQKRYKKGILSMPEIHKKAIIACYIASRLVYSRGIDWRPTIADILPVLVKDPLLKNKQII